MKHLRVVIVMLLALLLPVRGTVAAAMLCPGAEAPGTASVGTEHGATPALPLTQPHTHTHTHTHAEHGTDGGHAGEHAGPDAFANASTHHHPAAGGASDDDTSSSGAHPPGCQVCASGCCVVPLAFAPPSVETPVVSAAVSFPVLLVPVPAFQSGGQDRPPRGV